MTTDKVQVSTLHEALVSAQSLIQAAGKSGENKYDNYKYAMLQDYCNAIHEPMTMYGLALSVTIDEIVELQDRITSSGKAEHSVRVKLKGILMHKSGQTMEFTGWGEGQDRADKALYKAITGGKKYLIANIFNVPTTDDPETDSHEDFDKPHQNAGNTLKTEAKPQTHNQTPKPTKPVVEPKHDVKPIDDAEQASRGLINSTLIAEFKDATKAAKLEAKAVMDWLLMYSTALAQAGQLAKPFNHPKDIPASAYAEILEIVQKHPEQITGKV